MSRQSEGPYNNPLFDAMHNYVPALLYHPEQFNTVRECLEYIRDRARDRYNLFDRQQRLFTESRNQNDTDSESDNADSESDNDYTNDDMTHDILTNIMTQLMQNFMSQPVQQRTSRSHRQTENDIQYSIMSTTIPLLRRSLNVQPNMDPIIVRPTDQQIARGSQIVSTTATEELCSICQESMAHSEVRRINHCRHMFHQQCIDHWFERNVRCPVCRWDIREH